MQRFDRLVLIVTTGLLIAIAGVIALGDRAGASIRTVAPANGSNPPITAPIEITFIQPMNAASVTERFSIIPKVEGVFEWDGTLLRFVPEQPLEAGTTYTVTLQDGAESSGGRITQTDTEWNFTPREPSILFIAPVGSEVRSLWKVDGSGGEPQQLYAPDYGVFDFAVSRDGKQIAVTEFNEDLTTDLWIIKSDGSGGRVVTDCAPASCGVPAWSPDGSLLAYERQDASATGSAGPSRIWLYDVETDETAPVYEDNQVLGFGAAWSPDGTRLAFFDANQRAIRVLPVSGGEAVMLSNDMGEVGSFSADGTQMVFTDIRNIGQQFYGELWLADFSAGGGLRPLVDDAEEDQFPVWSPDGKWIAFARRRLDRSEGFGSQLMLYNTETQEVEQITDDPRFNNTRFVWDYTGTQLLIQRFDLDQIQSEPTLWLYDLSEGTLQQIAENGINAAWLP